MTTGATAVGVAADREPAVALAARVAAAATAAQPALPPVAPRVSPVAGQAARQGLAMLVPVAPRVAQPVRQAPGRWSRRMQAPTAAWKQTPARIRMVVARPIPIA